MADAETTGKTTGEITGEITGETTGIDELSIPQDANAESVLLTRVSFMCGIFADR
jgi:hypothetical protein